MPTAASIREQLLSVPEPIVNSIEAVAKAAGDNDGASEEAMAAMKAAGRILAPHADSISSAQITQLMQAIGMLAQDSEDEEASEDDLASNQNDAVIQAQESATNKAAAGDDAGEDDAQDDDTEPADKALPPWLKNKKTPPAKDTTAQDPDADGDDDAAVAGKKKTPLAKSAKADVSDASALGYSDDAPHAEALSPLETLVSKSAGVDLKGFTEAQRAALEPIIKSHALQAQAIEAQSQQLKEAVAKAAAAQHKLERKEFIAKAASLPHLGTAEELGEKLHNLHIKDPEGYDAWFNILKSANAASDASPLFREAGSRLSTPGNAEDKLQQAVSGIIQKSAKPMSPEMAEAEFLKTTEGKRLYAEVRKEANAARRSI